MMKNQYIAQSGWSWIAPNNPNSCDVGTMNSEAVDDAERRTNFYRNFVGLPSLTYERDTKQLATQRGSMAMSLNGEFGHNIKCKKNLCCLDDGISALSSSNIHTGGVTPQYAIDSFIRDDGSNNLQVGHRTWILTASLLESAIGVYDKYVTQMVIGVKTNYSQTQDYIAYPPPGPVPLRLIYPRISLVTRERILGSTGTITCNGEVIDTSVAYKSSTKMVLEIENMSKINIGTRCRVSISTSSSNDNIEYEFRAIDCFPNYVCSSYYANEDTWCSREYNKITSNHNLNSYYKMVDGNEITIHLARYSSRTATISPSTFLLKNHIIQTEDESPLYISNTRVNEIGNNQTNTKLRNIYLGFGGTSAVNLYDLEMYRIRFTGTNEPKNLTVNNVITDSQSLKATQNFLYAKKISIQNSVVKQINIKDDRIVVNEAEIIIDNFDEIEIHTNEYNFTIVVETKSLPKVHILYEDDINVTYETPNGSWDDVKNKENLVIGKEEDDEDGGDTNVGVIVGIVVVVIVVIAVIIVLVVLYKKGVIGKKKSKSSSSA
ncbi:CAP domain-containing protein [Histomonas meleagridis]|uniref:CAP domain-containing protein n=1 Tax=Histomonas meleagridis TaxID=135588 RepID=UPI00355A92AA|nr:CAP domain-containing protein [Histomonas meleagridis]KAH0805521.1 CAP domain-containing protein [Histomonas meleagridis]